MTKNKTISKTINTIVAIALIILTIAIFSRLTYPPKGIRTISIAVMILFLIGVYDRLRIWNLGEEDENTIDIGISGLIFLSFRKLFNIEGLLAKRTYKRSKKRGITLIFIIWSFIILLLGEIIKTTQQYLPIRILNTTTQPIFNLAMDLAGLILLIGITMAILRRSIKTKKMHYTTNKDKKVEKKQIPERIVTRKDDIIMLILLLLIVVLGFAVEGINLATIRKNDMTQPVGTITATIIQNTIGTNARTLQTLWKYTYIAHYTTVFLFILLIPYSKMFHIFASQITTDLAKQRKTQMKTDKR